MFFLHLYSSPELVLRKSFILEFSVSLFCHFLKDEKLLRILVAQPFPLSSNTLCGKIIIKEIR